jgi:aspartate/methionine/tyrosine aminotransferase
VASLYNELFRRGMPSRYSAENVALSGGGRVSIMRACAAIGQIHLGHFLPDYTAYEELLDIFRRFTPIPILLDPERGYDFSLAELRREVSGRGLGALLLSNPGNPTGKAILGPELSAWVATARELGCTLLLDEFYSHYVWRGADPLMSAAAFVEDVEKDPVVIFDGLTKNWRYPGWRTTWTVGPRRVIESLASAGSFLDGGGSRPLQHAALRVLTADHAREEALAIRKTFGKKRTRMLDGLRALGVRFEREPDGTFYAWGNLEGLPPPVDTGEGLFRAALEHKVIVVPGSFFDVDPGQRRVGRASRFKHHARFSFGPSEAVVDTALERLGRLVQSTR